LRCRCPACGASLLLDGDRLHIHDRQPGDDTATEVAADLPKWEKAVALMESCVKNDQRDLATAEAAAERLKDIEAQTGRDFDGEIEKAKEAIALIKDDLRLASADLDKVKESKRQAAEAETQTRQAAELHKAVQEWEAIADALAPDGIPGDFLKEAIGPVNASLRDEAESAAWAAPQIGGDMAITVGGRGYYFCSESEKWRADALIAAVIAMRSGAKFILLDRFDVLDATGRSDALYWLDGLMGDGGLDSAVVLGTLKAIPAGLPETIQGVWVQECRAETKEPATA